VIVCFVDIDGIKCCLPTFIILIVFQIIILFSTYFIFRRVLHNNQITSSGHMSLKMPVPSQDHYGFHSCPVVD
jgi:hypothetical protein